MTNNFKTAIASLVVLFGILGGVWAMEEHYTPRDFHELCMTQVQRQMADFQKTNQIQRAQDQVFYWMRIETQIREEIARQPNDSNLYRKLNEVSRQREAAQNQLQLLQSK